MVKVWDSAVPTPACRGGDERRRSPVTRPRKTSAALAAAAVVVLGLVVSPAAAKDEAKEPACWKVVINDWFDGTIDGKYKLSCYREALRRLRNSADIGAYTDAHDQINRAYQQRRAELAGIPSGGSGPTGRGPGSVVKPPRKGRHGDSVTTKPPSSAPPPSTYPGREQDAPAQSVLKTLGPDDATSIPIPLLVLAGIAVLLMAAGAASLLARRTRMRRVTVPVRTAPPASGS